MTHVTKNAVHCSLQINQIPTIMYYREFSSYANFICVNFITAIFQNFPKIFGLCVFIPTWLMQFWGSFCHLFCYCNHQVKICLMQFLANATLSRSQKSHQARSLCTNKISSGSLFHENFDILHFFQPIRSQQSSRNVML